MSNVERLGWLLVEADCRAIASDEIVVLTIVCRGNAGVGGEAQLRFRPSGRIQALVRVPAEAVRFDLSVPEVHRGLERLFRVRRIGSLERLCRMWYRVVRLSRVLSANERREMGLTLPRAVADLSGAFRISTEYCIWYPPFSYAEWVDRFDTLNQEEVQQIRAQIDRLEARPRFRILIDAASATEKAIAATIASVHAQLYREFEYTVLGSSTTRTHDAAQVDASVPEAQSLPSLLETLNAELASTGDKKWILRLRAGDVLPPHALYWFAVTAAERPRAVVMYADDDAIDGAGKRRTPRFKPDWSLAHLRETDYIGDAVLLRADALVAAGGVDAEACQQGFYQSILRIAESEAAEIAHLPAVLLHRQLRDEEAADERSALWALSALRKHLERCQAAAEIIPSRAGCRRVRYALPTSPPLVSIIVPTRDALNLLRVCVESVLNRTTYPRIELLVIDNRTSEPGALAYLHTIGARPRVKVLRYERPFNFSAINNFAAEQARGEVLCLLNNDTEVISPDWLDEMVGQLLQPRVGVVGAKLYYPDGRVQHAGDTVGPGGCANHLHSRIARDDPGYCNRAAVAQDLSAVTAACCVTRRELYLELGGLDARWLRVAFNDVDYCLRVRAAGWHVIWTPHAELYHHESVSRGKDVGWRRQLRAQSEVWTMRRRWAQAIRNDPFYNPNLNYRQPDFTLGRGLRVRKPWQ